GGTNNSSGGTTNGVFYFDGTRHTNSANFIFTGTAIGLGTTSPSALIDISNNTVNGTTTIFRIASSTASATTTLFSISNTGAITQNTITSALVAADNTGKLIASSTIGTSLLTGPLGTINGTTLNAGGSITVGSASTTLLANNNTFSGN